MRLQAEGPPDAMNGRGRVAARPRHRAKAPMGRVRRRLFQRQPDRFRDGVIADLTRRAGAGFVVQTVEALRRIAATPGLAHGVRARLETNGDLDSLFSNEGLLAEPPRRSEQPPRDLSPCDVLRRRDTVSALASNSAPVLQPFRRAKTIRARRASTLRRPTTRSAPPRRARHRSIEIITANLAINRAS